MSSFFTSCILAGYVTSTLGSIRASPAARRKRTATIHFGLKMMGGGRERKTQPSSPTHFDRAVRDDANAAQIGQNASPQTARGINMLSSLIVCAPGSGTKTTFPPATHCKFSHVPSQKPSCCRWRMPTPWT
jgi:hypothetical protein